jgi:hypothetical protein
MPSEPRRKVRASTPKFRDACGHNKRRGHAAVKKPNADQDSAWRPSYSASSWSRALVAPLCHQALDTKAYALSLAAPPAAQEKRVRSVSKVMSRGEDRVRAAACETGFGARREQPRRGARAPGALPPAPEASALGARWPRGRAGHAEAARSSGSALRRAQASRALLVVLGTSFVLTSADEAPPTTRYELVGRPPGSGHTSTTALDGQSRRTRSTLAQRR